MFYYKRHIVFLSLISVFPYTNCQKENNFFRTDYIFLQNHAAFYKFHGNEEKWQVAKELCEDEGSNLFYPEDAGELTTVFNWISSKLNDNSFYLYIGAQSFNGSTEFHTVDGRSLSSVYQSWSAGEPNPNVLKYSHTTCTVLTYRQGDMKAFPCNGVMKFLCKKTLESLEWNNVCDMAVYPGKSDYIYNSDLNKCYKFHAAPKTWTDAVKVCAAEQSYLAIPNSQDKANLLMELMKDMPEGFEGLGVVHLGFQLKPSGWMTLDDKTLLRDSGYPMWAYTQPDGGEWELCGAMAEDGRLHDVACDAHAHFICEHDVQRSD